MKTPTTHTLRVQFRSLEPPPFWMREIRPAYTQDFPTARHAFAALDLAINLNLFGGEPLVSPHMEVISPEGLEMASLYDFYAQELGPVRPTRTEIRLPKLNQYRPNPVKFSARFHAWKKEHE